MAPKTKPPASKVNEAVPSGLKFDLGLDRAGRAERRVRPASAPCARPCRERVVAGVGRGGGFRDGGVRRGRRRILLLRGRTFLRRWRTAAGSQDERQPCNGAYLVEINFIFSSFIENWLEAASQNWPIVGNQTKVVKVTLSSSSSNHTIHQSVHLQVLFARRGQVGKVVNRTRLIYYWQTFHR